ncbi:hypothetical protein [Vibrio algivorus]|uniref:Uncharacterized protein n=1 Tax=Vibrio algivorus TaxID=1667024 RepID=A0A557P6C2_9VIBR|nr:hypothetical protein [Vibrio algivorus]TVO36201.1 hypothetical protein FOF44_09830 [Vibrio algivorus]
MNQATLFLLHLKMLHDAKEPVPSNVVDADNITLLRSILADFANKTGISPKNIYTQHYTLDLGSCENIEIYFIDDSLAKITPLETKVFLPAPKKQKAGGALCQK